MNKRELIEKVAEKNGTSKVEAAKAYISFKGL